MINRKEFSGPVVVILILAFIIAALSLTGTASRDHLPGREVYTVDTNVDALAIWHRLGLQGRILVYFDNSMNLDDDFWQSLIFRFSVTDRVLPPADSRNFLIMALYHGIFRRVYRVVPDSQWTEIQQILSVYPLVSYSGGQLRYTIEGIPVIVTKQENIPRFYENATVFISNSYMRDHGDAGIKADLVVIRSDSG